MIGNNPLGDLEECLLPGLASVWHGIQCDAAAVRSETRALLSIAELPADDAARTLARCAPSIRLTRQRVAKMLLDFSELRDILGRRVFDTEKEDSPVPDIDALRSVSGIAREYEFALRQAMNRAGFSSKPLPPARAR